MTSLKALSICTVFDTLVKQRKIAIDMLFRAWGLSSRTQHFISIHPLAHMSWLRIVLGDMTMVEFTRAIAAYNMLNIKSARVMMGDGNETAKVILHQKDLTPRFAFQTNPMSMAEYETLDKLLRSVLPSDTWWFECDNQYTHLSDELRKRM